MEVRLRDQQASDARRVAESARPGPLRSQRLVAHLRICRVDHWFKNIFVLPGMVVAVSIVPRVDASDVAWHLAIGLLAVCLVASSNYVLNELQDAPYDVHHPRKRDRLVPSGLVNVRLAY